VPISGEGAPYDMSPEAVAEWGQSDYPVDATAIFPPTQVPSEEPPSDYSQATIHYMDPDGYEVNTASAAPPGVEGDAITTGETDVHGNVVRALTRLRHFVGDRRPQSRIPLGIARQGDSTCSAYAAAAGSISRKRGGSVTSSARRISAWVEVISVRWRTWPAEPENSPRWMR
jgi:hypothetical protein